MVEGQAEHHQVARHDLVADDRRPFFDSSKPQDRALRDVQDRCEGIDAVSAQVADREGAAGEVGGGEPTGLGTLRQVGQLRGNFAEAERGDFAHHRGEETGGRVDSDGNVDPRRRLDAAVDPLLVELRMLGERRAVSFVMNAR